MRVIHRIGTRIERIFEALGIIDTEPDDTLATALRPYNTRPSPMGAIFDRMWERDGCPHWHSNAVDDAPIGPDKVFHCPDCGVHYREVTAPGKPWLIADYRLVELAPEMEPNAGYGA